MLRYVVATFCSLTLLFTSEIHAGVVINEFLASNNENIIDQDGEHHDWIEFYNKGNVPVNLRGYHITDDAEKLGWQFPNVLIMPGSYLLVIASGKDISEGPELHTDFRISKDGNPLIFTNPDGFIADRIEAVKLPTDISYGRMPDGSDNWQYFDEPTPGSSNNISNGFQGKADKPEFSHKAGFYPESFELAIKSDIEDAEIYYTLDGSVPGPGDHLYEEPIKIEENNKKPGKMAVIPASPITNVPANPINHATVVRAVVVKEGYLPGDLATATYFISSKGRERYVLPVISISIDNDSLFDKKRGIYALGTDEENPNYNKRGHDWERTAGFEFFDLPERYYNLDLGLRIHGNWSRNLPQKSFRLYARREYGTNPMFYSFFPDADIHAFKRLIIRNSGNDWGGWGFGRDPKEVHRGTLFRDAVAQEIVSDMKFDVQNSRPSVLFLNGEYWGIYNIRERYDRFYIATNYGFDRDKVDMMSKNDVDEGTDHHFREMTDFISQNDVTEDSVYEHIKTLMDVQNFIEYNVAQMFLNNNDWPHNNFRYWRKQTNEYNPFAPEGQDGRWRWLMFDTDFGLGFAEAVNYDMVKWVFEDEHRSEWEWAFFLIRTLIENPDFRDDFLRTVCDHLNTTFRPENTLPVIDRFTSIFEPEIKENINRWGAPSDYETWEDNVSDMRAFTAKRPEFFRKHVAEYFNKHRSSQVVLNANAPEMGYLKINDIKIEGKDLTWRGDYYEGLTLEIRAVPYEGARFAGWSGGSSSNASHLKIDHKGDIYLKAHFEADPDYQPGYTLPEPFVLADDDFHFTQWNKDAPAGTYPPNMAFHQYHYPDPGINHDPVTDYTQPYNLTTKSRINGLGSEGFSFKNTNNPQPEPEAGYAGAAIVALDTREQENIRLSWEATTVNPNVKSYGIRVQYRTGKYGPFKNLKDKNNHYIEYIRNKISGHRQKFDEITLPEYLEDQPYVLLRFKYYYRHANSYYEPPSGPRAELAVNNIRVTSEKLTRTEEPEVQLYPNPSRGNLNIRLDSEPKSNMKFFLYDLSGRRILDKNIQSYPGLIDYRLSLSNTIPGVYIAVLKGADFYKNIKIVIE